ncbi:MAG TPA: PEP-CTERM sorting domain-containing protein [Tepidisphaeraceae bacterium]|nr:PEP-CTERM sorting domain-containing protein [Tepidisphaeraceae bacterium]
MAVRTGWIVACIAAAAVVCGATVAQAELSVDLRQTGTGLSGVTLTPRDLNQPIFIDVFVSVTGAAGNPRPETFTSLQGSFISHAGAIGEIAPAGYNHWAGMDYGSYGFADWGATSGQSLDLDGDGDMDLGAPIGQAPVAFRSAVPLAFNGNTGCGTELPDGGVRFLVGRISFTPTAMRLPYVTFVPRMSEPGVTADEAALWTEDGQLRDGETGSILVFPFGGIPEPSSLCMLSLAGAMLLRTRRNASAY